MSIKQVHPLRKIIGLALFILVICGGVWQLFFAARLEACQADALLVCTPQTMNSFQEDWSLSNIFIMSRYTAINLVTNNNRLIFYGSTKACDHLEFITMDPRSGMVIEPGLSGIPSNTGINNIVYDSQYLYLGFDGTGKTIETSVSGAAGVAAYKIDTGDLIWMRKITGARGIRSLAVGDGYVVVDGTSFSNQYYLLDSTSGEIVQTLEEELGTGLLTYAFWVTYVNDLDTIPKQTISFWQDKLTGVEQPPVLLGTKIVVRTNPGSQVGQVKVLDRLSGQNLWETENNVVSNVAVNNTGVFF